MDKPKTVLVYVLSHGSGCYPSLMDSSIRTWASRKVDGADVLFYTNAPDHSRHKLVIPFSVGSGLYDIGHKDLAAYEWALVNRKWDFMARVNSSCYVRLSKLVPYVQPLPTSGLFMGVRAKKPDGTPFLWGGAQYIISRDVVEAFVANRQMWNHREMEDVSMSILAEKLGYDLNGSGKACSINRTGNRWTCMEYGGPGFVFDNFSEMEKADQHFIRVKQDGNRAGDVMIMGELWKNKIC